MLKLNTSFFLTATQLEQIKKDFDYIDEQVSATRNVLARKRKALPEMEQQVKALSDEWRELKALASVEKKNSCNQK